MGNTSLNMSSEQVKQVLERCAAGVQGNTAHLEVLEVKEIGTDLPNRRTRCWKVKVPHVMKELMQESSLYPKGWTHRRYFEQRSGNKRAKTAAEQTPTAGGGGLLPAGEGVPLPGAGGAAGRLPEGAGAGAQVGRDGQVEQQQEAGQEVQEQQGGFL